ncbi:MAG: ROK family transcriptional regulator [Spirochaetes bacterium]|nr:ROK family transcriptional regulator [Spirochaetota bacterium]
MRNFARSNYLALLKEIFLNPGIMRYEMSERLDMSSATVTKYVEMMIRDGIIREADNHKGRKVALTLTKDWYAALGVDIGGYQTRIGMFYADGSFTKLDEVRTPGDPRELMPLIQKYERNADTVGIAVTAVVDAAEQRIFIFANQRTWDGFSFRTAGISKPVFLTTSGNAAAGYEKRFGTLKPYENCMHVMIGTGIQAGLFINNTLVEGANHAAGEFGHVFSTAEAGPCTCGKVGCLENIATISMVQRRLEKQMRDGNLRGTLAMLCGNDPSKMTIDILKRSIAENDPQVMADFKRVTEAIAAALSGIVNVLNPEAVSFGGRMIDVYPGLVNDLQQAVRLTVLESNSKHLTIAAGKEPLLAACIGAALIPMEHRINTFGGTT